MNRQSGNTQRPLSFRWLLMKLATVSSGHVEAGHTHTHTHHSDGDTGEVSCGPAGVRVNSDNCTRVMSYSGSSSRSLHIAAAQE